MIGLSRQSHFRLSAQLGSMIASPFFWAAITLCGLAVRFRQFLFVHSYWYDEAFLVLAVRARSLSELLGPQPYNLVIPPLYMGVIQELHNIGGDNELLLRLPAFLAGIAALFLMIPLSRRMIGNAQAVWALAFLAGCRHAISHGCEVRPYTFDLLLMEGVLYCVALLLDPKSGLIPWRLAAVGLMFAALFGPWLSFPCAFALAAASIAIAAHIRRHASWRDWLAWLAFNVVTGASGALLWWFSARHLHSEHLVEHWRLGWGGFPDLHSPLDTAAWMVWRPIAIGNYGNREIGLLLTALAVPGAFELAKRSRALVVLLLAPFAVALLAALLGKYPLADRTSFFLLPCLWLLSASGVSRLVSWGRRHGRELAFAGLLLIAWDFACLAGKLVEPDGRLDYRGAYQFVHAHRQPTDQLWSQTTVVYETYYGKTAPVLHDSEFHDAVRRARSERVWFVLGDNRDDLRQRCAASGGRVALRHHVSGLDVLLLEPRKAN